MTIVDSLSGAKDMDIDGVGMDGSAERDSWTSAIDSPRQNTRVVLRLMKIHLHPMHIP